MSGPEEQRVDVACAFCGEGVDYTDDDPIAIGVVERWRPYDEQPDRTLYAHRACLYERLHPEVRELFDQDDDE